ncbi:nuclease-related domain-containing protein [Methanosarcina sp. T3]|uniref:nuclease-related domain-containing protein n=1 Tax=Methanosarcina sp. T3 TaxID=3439062 RepID=UPI003F83DECF
MRYPQELASVDADTSLLEAEIEKLEKTIESKSLEIEDDISLRVKNLEGEIDKLRSIKFSLSSLFSFLSAKFTLYNKRKLLQNLKLNPQKEIDRLLNKEYSELQLLTKKCTYLENNKNDEVKKRMGPLCESVEYIEKIKNSPEYSGAVGELKVIKNLQDLPDDYFLLNDLFLELDEYINFDGSKLRSAQIDHMVVGPTGVFVIETKNWSSKYVQKVFSEDSYTPYDQIRRSSYLAYKYLNSLKYGNIFEKIYFNLAKNEIKIKSVIAISGADMPHIKGKHTYVVRTNELSSHIRRAPQVFSEEEAHEIAEKLIPRVRG